MESAPVGVAFNHDLDKGFVHHGHLLDAVAIGEILFFAADDGGHVFHIIGADPVQRDVGERRLTVARDEDVAVFVLVNGSPIVRIGAPDHAVIGNFFPFRDDNGGLGLGIQIVGGILVARFLAGPLVRHMAGTNHDVLQFLTDVVIVVLEHEAAVDAAVEGGPCADEQFGLFL